MGSFVNIYDAAYEVYYEGVIIDPSSPMYDENTMVMEMYKTEDYTFDEDAAEYIHLAVQFEQLEENDGYMTMYRISGDKLFGNEDSDEYEMYPTWG